MRRIWLALAAVLLCVEIGYGAEIEIPAEVTDAVPPEAAALLDGAVYCGVCGAKIESCCCAAWQRAASRRRTRRGCPGS